MLRKEEFWNALAMCETTADRLDLIRARDAEWQARVDRAVDEAVSQAKKVAQSSEDYRARDAEIRRECADRAVAWLKTLHHEPEAGLPWSGKIRRMQDLQIQTLRAAIMGEEEA